VKVPGKIKQLREWNDEQVHACSSSRANRITQYGLWTNYYYAGTSDANPAQYNKIFPDIDRKGSYLFSPKDVRYTIDYEETDDDAALLIADRAGRYLSKKMKPANLVFRDGIEYGLIKGKCLGKITWTGKGLNPSIVQPDNFGVYNEAVSDLDEQECFLMTTWHTIDQVRRQIEGHPDEQKIIKDLKGSMQSDTDETRPGNFIHQIIMGGLQPVATTPPVTPMKGMVGVTGGPVPQLDPQVMASLVKRDELWVWDDERDDYTTIVSFGGSGQSGGNVITEGRYKHRNLSDVKGEHPFFEVCPHPVDGYFWGRSEIANLYILQDVLNMRVSDVNDLLGLRARPPVGYIGVTGMTREKHAMLMRRGGFMSDPSPGGKIEKLAPDMPPDLLQQVDAIIQYMDDVGGFAPIMQGQGDSGVRAGNHAQTLVRTGSPRLRDRALLVENQCADMGDTAFRILQAKQPTVLKTGAGKKDQEFILAQVPEDGHVIVDSHSSSPAFSEEADSRAFALAKAGAIDGEDLIMLTHPPLEDRLIRRYRERAAAEAEERRLNPPSSKPGPKPKR
jgi:hypothetical protein